MTYRDNVEQAALALKRGEDANWELARLTHESTRTGAKDRERATMAQWCADVSVTAARGFSEWTGEQYKRCWVYRLEHERANGTLSLTWMEVYDAVRPGQSAGTTMQERFAKQSAQTVVAHGTPEVKRAAFQQLARDPDVIEEAAMLGTPTSRAVSDLYTKTERVREEWTERETASDPISKRLDEVGAALDLEAACNRFARDLVAMSERFAREINEALPRTGPAREEHLYWVRQALERARSVLNELESYAETGRTDLDAFLEGVLGGR